MASQFYPVRLGAQSGDVFKHSGGKAKQKTEAIASGFVCVHTTISNLIFIDY
jgi:hypothetical protein